MSPISHVSGSCGVRGAQSFDQRNALTVDKYSLALCPAFLNLSTNMILSEKNGVRMATLGQIAKEAGVSVSAVSRILSGKKLERFSKPLIERVRAIAEQCRYRPNRLVNRLRTGYSGMIGVIVPVCDEFYTPMVNGIHDALIAEDRVPIILWTIQDSHFNDGKSGRSELDQIHALVDRRVDGIILKPNFEAASDEYLHEITDRNIPLVTVDRELSKFKCCYVGSDDEIATNELLDHLAALGHRSIAYFGPTTTVSTGVHRLQRFRTWMSEHPEIAPTEHLVNTWEPTIEDAIALLERKPRPTAISAVHDPFAWLIYDAAYQMGLRIPEDVSIVGFGNLFASKLLRPRLTTVDQHAYEIGRSAVQRVLLRIANPSEGPKKVLLPPDLIVGGSTGPASPR